MDFSDRYLWEKGYQTRDGRDVRIIGYEPKYQYGVIGCIEGEPHFTMWGSKGEWSASTKSPLDLVPRPVIRKGWIGIARNTDPRYVARAICTDIYETEVIAEQQMAVRGWLAPYTIIEIEYPKP